LVFLIVLIVATAVLIAWLLVELARVALGDFRFPWLRESSVQSAPTAGPPLPAVGGRSAESSGADSGARTDHPEADEARAERAKPPAERVLYDETDVEMAVRDRLYGRHGRRD
jgi:hypothetical protein